MGGEWCTDPKSKPFEVYLTVRDCTLLFGICAMYILVLICCCCLCYCHRCCTSGPICPLPDDYPRQPPIPTIKQRA
ncbi:hypothetical protein PRIPAC_90421 [Pristionchus pacificus]|uniref:Uncharacterized protein n=1 Tax=Pristionchus pacificus TaxID=54126 RepID=A0A2A6CTJ2_PRIPA|nr:hypothetical protein PRIPAC_90421 [Pristionchus pacificus]|eukprot:PDM81469.1 hypothetical protein PRIPAC_35345 [Pristionchus pacificus]